MTFRSTEISVPVAMCTLLLLLLLLLGSPAAVQGGSTAKSVLMFAVDDLRTQLSVCTSSHTTTQPICESLRDRVVHNPGI